MKSVLKLSFLLLMLVSFIACEKDQDEAVLNPEATVELVLSNTNVVLESDKSDEVVLSISWKVENSQVSLAPSYMITFMKDQEVKKISAEKSPLELTGKQLNEILMDLKVKPEEATDVKITVASKLSEYVSIVSKPQLVSLTAYKDVPNLTTEWGVVGTTNNWGGSPDTPFWKVVGDDNKYVAYLTVEADGEIKFRKNEDWRENFGDNGADGSLESGAANIPINQGIYRIEWNLGDNTYKIEKYTWGIIGDGANGWGDNDDVPLHYNGLENVWEGKDVVLKDGEIKFRLNNDWAVNYGDNGADGTLDSGGDNIAVSAGTYDIMVDFSGETPKYKLVNK